MKKMLGIALMGSAVFLAACDQGGEAKQAAVELKTDDDKAAYSVGFLTGKNMKRDLKSINGDALIAGLRAAFDEGEPQITEADMQGIIQAWQQRLVAQQQEEAKVLAEKNKTEGEAFLAENAQKEGVMMTESGLQYEIITEGTGEKPGPVDTVEAHYHGTLIDGTVFDSSVERGSPAKFPLNRVIKGWTEALQLMPVGSKWKLYIPSELGYGQANSGGPIGPNSVLIFEVELLGVEKAEAPAEG